MKRALVGVAVVCLAGEARAGNQCHEVSDTVGERKCSTFGQRWATERSIPMFAAFGGWSSVVQPTGRGFDGTLRAPDGANPVAFRSSQVIRGPIRSFGVDLRLGGYFARYGYVALDWALGLGHAQGQPWASSGYRIEPASGVNFFHARVGPAVGVRVPLGKVSLRFEGLTALQLLLLSTEVYGPEGTRRDGGGGGVMLALEPRAAIDLWVAPDTTLSAWAGANLLRSGDYTSGLSLAAHVRAFDGAF